VNDDTPYVAVVGAGEFEERICSIAEDVGREIARRGCVLVCGGLEGVMEAACRGAKAEGGTTIGILPGTSRSEANVYVDVAIRTGMGEMRNALIVRSADVVIAVGGEYGTLSEVAFALKTGKPVVGIEAWELSKDGRPIEAFPRATTATEAVEKALSLLGDR
jgi:uncharacterized protein (TIGR00725 family)